MKILLITIVVCVFAATDASRRSTRRQQFDDWRACMVGQLPTEKKPIYEACHNRSRGTDMHKFREGLKCVLTDYSLLNGTKIDLAAMTTRASSVSGKLGQAFTDCPKDDHNRNAAKGVKCIIDRLETDCPVPTGSTTR
uniref:Putative secreted protein n=1 Tax=Ixodes ricinus TaxID=34613 RepID=A0A0K8R5E6_IXORI